MKHSQKLTLAAVLLVAAAVAGLRNASEQTAPSHSKEWALEKRAAQTQSVIDTTNQKLKVLNKEPARTRCLAEVQAPCRPC